MRSLSPVAALAASLLLVCPVAAPRADDIPLPDAAEVEDALPEGTSLSGREIWERFIDNRIKSAVQKQRLISKDPGGGQQKGRFWVRWKDYRDANGDPVDGIVAKGVVRVEEPPDLRGTSFLLVVNDGRDPDQFLYSPELRRVRRVKLQKVGVAGSDWTFDGINWREIEDADYHRGNDETVDGQPVYVVEATIKPYIDSQYDTARAWIDKDTYVPLRVVYSDENGVALREIRVKHDTIRKYDGAWVPTETTIENLKEKTTSVVFLDELDANPELSEQLFSPFRLETEREAH